MNNSFGNIFRITTFGESHGKGIGVVIDGCPAGLKVRVEDIQFELDRRRPGQSNITTSRKERDCVEILSGIYQETTLGTSIALLIKNSDAKTQSYNHLRDLYRPGHADYTYDCRYGFRDWRGGGRASARETAARVAAGAVAKLILKELINVETLAWVNQIHHVHASVNMENITSELIENNAVRCPDSAATKEMESAIIKAKKGRNSVGGIIKFKVNNCPAGLGAPIFNKLTAEIAKACMSIPATRNVSFGLGEKAAELTGYEHNDLFVIKENNKIGTSSNNAGGVLGGISNGEVIYGSITFKPTATINKEQATVNCHGEELTFKAGGRHDPCVLPRAVPIVEAMINLVLVDHVLLYAISNMARLHKIFY